MAPINSNNYLYRLLWSLSHSPQRVLEFIQFTLLVWVLIHVLTGFGGFLAYGEPMVGVSKSLILLCMVHALALAFREDRPGIDPVLLVPVPYLVYAWVHFQFISSTSWQAGASFAVYLQAYALFIIVYNSMHSVRSGKWMLVLLQLPVIAALTAAFLKFYLFPEWIQDASRLNDPAYAHGAGGFLQDPANLGFLLMGLLPMCLIFAVKHLRKGPLWIYYLGLGVCILVGLLISANKWGLLVLLLILVAAPVFTTGRWRKRVKTWKWIALVVPVLLFSLWYGSAGIHERMAYLLSDNGDLVGQESRQVAVRLFLDNPLTGSGLGSFGQFWASKAAPEVEGVSRYAVSGYAGFLAENGLIGLILLTAILIVLGVTAFRAWNNLPYVRLSSEAADRLKKFPRGHPIHRRLRRDEGHMPNRKAALGSLILGGIGLILYAAFDYAMSLPVALFYAACFAATALAHARGYKTKSVRTHLWIGAAVLPLALVVLASFTGVPRFYANHLTFTAKESLDELLREPDLIFLYPERLYVIENQLLAATELVPGHGSALAYLGTTKLARLEAQLESAEDIASAALPVIQRGLEVAPENWIAHFNAGRALILAGREPRPALEHLRRAATLAPHRVEPVALYGSILLMRDPDSVEGMELLRRIMAEAPDYQPVVNAIRWTAMRNDLSGDAGRIQTEAGLVEQFGMLPDPWNRINGAGLPRPVTPTP